MVSTKSTSWSSSEHALTAVAVGRHNLEREAFAHPVVLVLEHRHEPTVVVVAHQPDAGLHAQHALVLAARHGHVGHGAELELGHPLRSTHELRQPSAIALHHRQPDDLDASLRTGNDSTVALPNALVS